MRGRVREGGVWQISKRAVLELSQEVREDLIRISRSRTEPEVKVRRAKILLLYSEGKKISEIAVGIKTNRPAIERVIDKALAFGCSQALKDLPRSGRPALITDDAKSWVISLACKKPIDLGYAHETWTYSLLIKHLRGHCEEQGYSCLAALGKGRLHSILSKSNVNWRWNHF